MRKMKRISSEGKRKCTMILRAVRQHLSVVVLLSEAPVRFLVLGMFSNCHEIY